MKKADIVQALIAKVEGMLERAKRDKQVAQKEANSHVGAMQSRYDTFKEEAQALVVAQDLRIMELRTWVGQLRELLLQGPRVLDIQPGEVRIGALVTLADSNGVESEYFFAPAGGGEVVELGGKKTRILSPKTPLAADVLGKRVGDEATLGRREMTIIRIE